MSFSTHKALHSLCSTRKLGVAARTCNLNTLAGGLKIRKGQGRAWLLSEFQANLAYVRSGFKKIL